MKKKFFKAFFSLLIVLLIGFGLHSLSFKQKANDLPLPALYKKGVFHVHSNFSDGRGNIEEICLAANRDRLDFVILNDHGRPNRQSAAASGWHEHVVLIGASEFSLNEGHLAAAGFRVPAYIFPPEASEAIAEINESQGFSFVSHPFDDKIPWSGWQVRDFSGIEIISLYQIASKASLLRIAALFWQYLWNPDYALTAIIAYPRREIQQWDSMNQHGKHSAIYALDAHAKMAITPKIQFGFPSYRSMFRILTVYVKVDEKLQKDSSQAEAAIVAAIGRGNFFNVIESLAPANGFENVYLEKNGQLVEMGGDAQAAGGTLIFKLPFHFATNIVVKKDGEIFETIRSNTRKELSMPIRQTGVYRAEISLTAGRFKSLPWIMTNPIYIAQPAVEKETSTKAAGIILADVENYFQVEKNGSSSANVQWDAPAGEPPVTRFTFTLRPEAFPEVNFWTALAHRGKIDGSHYQGFVFETRGSSPMRFWLQFRTGIGRGEAAYQHSFPVKEQWRKIVIPFSSFHRLYGPPALPNPLPINAFFFLIDNGNAFPGTQGEIFFRQIGLY